MTDLATPVRIPEVFRRVISAAVVTGLIAVIGSALAGLLGGHEVLPVALVALAGAVVGALIQGTAAWLLLRRREAAMVGFLGAFALAGLARLLGGAVVVIAVLAAGLPLPGAFFAAFAAQYVVLEVVTDVLFVRAERRADRAG